MARLFALILWIGAGNASAQLPASGTLSQTDGPLFRAEVARVEKMLATASDRDSIVYQMARTFAAGKQWPDTIEWLRKIAERKSGLDPSRDSIFAALRGTKEFAQVVAAVRDATPPVSHSTAAFKVSEGDLAPESMAYDSKRGNFYFGSMRKGKVLRCTASGDCSQFATGLGVVLGIKVQGDALWLLDNSDKESALLHYDLTSGRVVRKYSVTGEGHNFNDLVLAPDGGIYLTDTRAAAVWNLERGASELKRFSGKFEFANGIALSPDLSLLYVSTFGDGISVVDLKTGASAPIGKPGNLCLSTIDGLYFHRGALIAIQNGFMSPRVVRLILSRDLRSIERFDVLERRNPSFEGVTTGVIDGDDFYYMANIQDDKKASFDPITILKIHLLD